MASPPVSLRLGSRGSPLALAQAHLAAGALAAIGVSSGLVTVETEGDRVRDRPLAALGGKGVWTKELDAALLDGRIDAAVHSLKDVETRLPECLVLAAVLPRADPRDRLVGAASLAGLPPGARVGTSSPRRAAQLAARRPDVSAVLLRGNVATRLARVEEGAVDATFLAAAGLERLGIAAGVALDPKDWLPAAAQGIVGITARADDTETLSALARIDHPATHLAALAERAVLAGIGGSCRTAIAVHARPVAEGRLELGAELYSPDGQDRVDAGLEAAVRTRAEAEALGRAVADSLLAQATPAIRASLG
ncbi:hydroxymethylbilane synthase [Thermaurantiacus tibetensis]|uniref:hydroxymethylbilane synthase n=1 Tax=Thermaurantiacus tibetensis TaxID=2759035 RepID=UPI00188F2704|nr:hydroxymethylbilane synthase [Thermaurantiacus tibetensis]